MCHQGHPVVVVREGLLRAVSTAGDSGLDAGYWTPHKAGQVIEYYKRPITFIFYISRTISFATHLLPSIKRLQYAQNEDRWNWYVCAGKCNY